MGSRRASAAAFKGAVTHAVNDVTDIGLTSKQLAFFTRLIELQRRMRVPPTVRELQQECGYRSPRSVQQFLDALESRGYIRRAEGVRNIRILTQAPMATAERRTLDTQAEAPAQQ